MEKKAKINPSVKSIIDAYTAKGEEKIDPEGWYTGYPTDKCEKPVQDADDL